MARLVLPSRLELKEAHGIIERGALEEGHLDVVLVRLARADDPVVVPCRDPSPLPILDDIRVGLMDEGSEPAEHLAPPVAEHRNPLVDQLRGRPALLWLTLRHTPSPIPVPRVTRRVT
jgi:hypothetical protein